MPWSETTLTDHLLSARQLVMERLALLDDAGSFFVPLAKSNIKANRRYSHSVDRSPGLNCDTLSKRCSQRALHSGALETQTQPVGNYCIINVI
jgi:hypothetical protein